MCDQDHFEKDRQEYEARGLVTRKQFGVMLGAGMAMMLPKVANAAAVTESEVNITTPDGTRRLLLRAPFHRRRPRRSHVARYLRPAPRLPPDGQAPRRIRLLGAGRESVLPRQESPDRGRRCRHAHPLGDAAGAEPERNHRT